MPGASGRALWHPASLDHACRETRCTPGCSGALRDFWAQHPDAKAPLEAWIDEVKHADWKDAHDIKAKYRSASPVGNKRVVFNIKGNDYRLIVAVAYRFGVVYIKLIGTHAEYDKVDAETVEME